MHGGLQKAAQHIASSLSSKTRELRRVVGEVDEELEEGMRELKTVGQRPWLGLGSGATGQRGSTYDELLKTLEDFKAITERCEKQRTRGLQLEIYKV